MPKAKGFKDAIDALRVRDANKLPREGFFSTLDELINAAPQDQMTTKQWREYLAPGRVLEREGVNFPLKKEELEYALPAYVREANETLYPGKDSQRITKEQLSSLTRRIRPQIDSTGMHSVSGGQFNDYSTKGPNRVKYFEQQTDSPDFGKFPTHFDQNNLSWARGSIHDLEGEGHPGGGMLRLIDEIQSDRHAAAADKMRQLPDGSLTEDVPGDGSTYPVVRRGYRTPEQENLMKSVRQRFPSGFKNDREYIDARKTPPDAPFKSAGDYGRLELKRGILNAVEHGDRYLGVTPSEGPIGWFNSGPEQIPGMKHAYDSVYPGELRKLAHQYGAPFGDVPLTVHAANARTLPTLEHLEMDFPDAVEGMADDVALGLYSIPSSLIREMREASDNPDVHEALNKAEQHLKAHQARFETLKQQHPEQGNNLDVSAEGLSDTEAYTHSDALQNALHAAWAEHGKATPMDSKVRKVPAMELTPEVVEKIKKAGIPLWAITSGIVGIDQLTGEPSEGPAFGKGGLVHASAAKLRELMSDPLSGQLLREGADKVQAENMARAADRRAATGAPNYDARFDALVQKYNPNRRGPDRRVTRLPDRTIEPPATDPVEKSGGGGVTLPDTAERKAAHNKTIEGIDRMATYIGTPDKATRRRQLAAGLLSQVYGLNDKGEASFLGADEPVNSDPSGSGLGELSAPSIRPGMLDELLALPSMFGGGPKVSQNAAARTEELGSQIEDSMGLEPPKGFDENLSRSLGVMLGQLPVPARKAKAGLEIAGTGVKKLGALAKKYGTGAHEFFSPVIEPSVGNYASGALFGGALGTAPEWLETLAKEHPDAFRKLMAHPEALPEGYGSREQEVGFADGGLVGMSDPRLSPLTGGTLANAGGQRQYIGTPKTEADLAHYGEGPAASYFANNNGPGFQVDWSKDGSGIVQPEATEGGGNNALIGVLGSLPQIYKGLGTADKVLGTDMTGTIKDYGSKAYNYGKEALGLGSAASATLPASTAASAVAADSSMTAAMAPYMTEGAAGTGAAASSGMMGMGASAMQAAPVLAAAWAAMPYFNKLVGNDSYYTPNEDAQSTSDNQYASEGYLQRIGAEGNPLSALFSSDKGLALGYNGSKFTDMDGNSFDIGLQSARSPANAKMTYNTLQKKGAKLPSLEEFTKYWNDLSSKVTEHG